MIREQPPDHLLYSVGCGSLENCDYIILDLDVGNGEKLHLLVDSGADISLLKSRRLLGTVEFKPRDRVGVKSVERSVIETHESIETKIFEGSLQIPFRFQLASKQVDLLGDGILGQDFLKQIQAKICYHSRTLTFTYAGVTITKSLSNNSSGSKLTNSGERAGRLRIPLWSETIVRLPAETGSTTAEGLVERKKLLPGGHLAGSLVKVVNGCVITSVLNTTEKEVNMPKPVVMVTGVDTRDPLVPDPNSTTKWDKSRYERVLNKLRMDHLNSEEKTSLGEICFNYQDVFFLTGDRLSCTSAVKHTIHLEPGTIPINTHPYRLPESQRKETDRQVTNLLKEGIIVESNSPWNSPILVVPKRVGLDGEKKWRLVVDFRCLNEKTIGDTHSLPDITEILDQLRQSKHFTCLDMVMGYHPTELEEGEGPKTAFSTKQGHWEYRRLPFGLKTTPATFQKLMNSVLSVLTGTHCFVYLDDIVIYAKSLADHNIKLREVLDRLKTYRLKLQPEKCEFLHKEVNYLGHQITKAGVKPDPQKVAAITSYLTPTSVKELKTFCGMISYYHRFIPNCSRIVFPLHKLFKKNVKFEWKPEQEHAFQHLKAKLTSQPILQYPEFSKEFTLTTDASNTGLGAVLSQGLLGKDLPVAYASRSLNKAEINYTTSEKEL